MWAFESIEIKLGEVSGPSLMLIGFGRGRRRRAPPHGAPAHTPNRTRRPRCRLPRTASDGDPAGVPVPTEWELPRGATPELDPLDAPRGVAAVRVLGVGDLRLLYRGQRRAAAETGNTRVACRPAHHAGGL